MPNPIDQVLGLLGRQRKAVMPERNANQQPFTQEELTRTQMDALKQGDQARVGRIAEINQRHQQLEDVKNGLAEQLLTKPGDKAGKRKAGLIKKISLANPFAAVNEAQIDARQRGGVE